MQEMQGRGREITCAAGLSVGNKGCGRRSWPHTANNAKNEIDCGGVKKEHASQIVVPHIYYCLPMLIVG